MTQPRLPLPRLATHRMSAPNADDARGALRDLTEADLDELWPELTAEAGIPAGVLLLDLGEMQAVADVLLRRPGVLGLAGRALSIRVGTYRELSGSAGGALPADWARRSMELLLRGRVPDTARLAEIIDLDLFSARARERLDRAAKRAAVRFGAMVGLVTVVLEGSQEFAGSHGLSGWVETVGGTPVEWSFCATAVRTREPYLVPDATRDVIQRTNPVVEKDGIVGYAGVPLITSRGQVLGTYCVLHGAPLQLSEADVAELQTMAEALVADLERDRLSERSGRTPAR